MIFFLMSGKTRRSYMKFIILACLLLLPLNVFAGASGEIVLFEPKDSGVIFAWTQYKIDGVEVQTSYPKINDKYVKKLKFNVDSCFPMEDGTVECLLGKTTAEKLAILKEQIKLHCNMLTMESYRNATIDSDTLATELNSAIGDKVSVTSVSKKVDTDGDGKYDKEFLFKTDGTKTEKSIDEVIPTN